MEKILFEANFDFGPLISEGTSTPSLNTTFTQCNTQNFGNREGEDDLKFRCQAVQTEVESNFSIGELSNGTPRHECFDMKKTPEYSDDKLQNELETIFKSCKSQMENKAQLAAKIKHAEWLRAGQSLEDVVQEYFKDDIEILEKAQALRLHFEHEKNKFIAGVKATTSNYFTEKKDHDNDDNEKFDYGVADPAHSSYPDYYSSSPYKKRRSFNGLSWCESREQEDGYPPRPREEDNLLVFRQTTNESFLHLHDDGDASEKPLLSGKKSRPFKSPKK